MTVYIGRNGGKYHTDRECHYIKNNSVRHTTEDHAKIWTDGVCEACSGQRVYNSKPGNISDLERILKGQTDD